MSKKNEITPEQAERFNKAFAELAEKNPMAADEFISHIGNGLPNKFHSKPIGEVCEHRSLKRQCEICDLQDELAHLRAENERLTGKINYICKAKFCPSCEKYWSDFLTSDDDPNGNTADEDSELCTTPDPTFNKGANNKPL